MTAPARSDGITVSQLEKMLRGGVDNALARLRRTDPDAASDMDTLRRREQTRPTVVVVGETKRGKSSLANALVGVPDLSPVDAAVATSAYLEFVPSPHAGAQAYLPGREDPVTLRLEDIRDWGTVLGSLPDGMRPPRRLQISHPAPLLQYVNLVDTPGVGGLDSLHAEVAMDAVERATVLLFVVDAASPFSKPEMDFLIEASKRVNLVLFALTKIDAFPGWRTILDDNVALLQAHAPRFGSAPFYPVSSRLAEMALRMPRDAAAELVRESRVADLQHALIKLASRGHLLKLANLLRAVRSEFIRLDLQVAERARAADPDPEQAARLKEERARVNSRKRSESKQWSLALNTETSRAKLEATGRLRTYFQKSQEQFLNQIDKADRGALKKLPYDVDRALHALSVRMSAELEYRFRMIGQRILAQVFTERELHLVMGRINAQLRVAMQAKPRRDTSGDTAMVVMSSAGTLMMGTRAVTAGAAAAGLGVAGGAAALAVSTAGIGLGLAAAAFIIYKRRVQTDRNQARQWLREVMNESRAAMQDEIMHRFTDLQYSLTLVLDDAIERRLKSLDGQITAIDQAMAEDKATRQKHKAELSKEREALKARITKIDEVLAKTRGLVPAPPPSDEEASG
ncbi:MAG TPA: dynamin family protein [Micromonosporaceae bacterium]